MLGRRPQDAAPWRTEAVLFEAVSKARGPITPRALLSCCRFQLREAGFDDRDFILNLSGQVAEVIRAPERPDEGR
jgi:hypothetical protein